MSSKEEYSVKIIDEYINLYIQFYTKYEGIIEKFKKDFIQKFKDENFDVNKKYSIYSSKYKSKEIILVENENLEIKLDVHNIGSRAADFCNYKLDKGFVYNNIITSVRAYRIEFYIGSGKNTKKVRSIKDLEDIKQSILNNRYTVDEIDNIIENTVANKTEVLENEFNKLEDIYFIFIEKKKSSMKKKFNFKSIEELIVKLKNSQMYIKNKNEIY